MTLTTGHIVAERYEILAPISSGGMGAVYRAADRHFKDRVVALKQMLEDGSWGDQADLVHQKFESEAEMLLKLQHPSIPRIVDHFKQGDSHFVVMEFIAGDSLDVMLEQSLGLARQPLDAVKVVRIALVVCDVLAYLHSRTPPIVHRGVKPGNIIVRHSDQHVFLVDFGLARPLNPHSARSKTMVGTLGYAALEQVTGHPEPRSDIYGLGATMYHLISGLAPPPFDVPPLEGVDRALTAAVEKATRQVAEVRFESVSAMAGELRAVLERLESGPVVAAAPGPPPAPSVVRVRTAGSTLATGRQPVGTRVLPYAAVLAMLVVGGAWVAHGRGAPPVASASAVASVRMSPTGPATVVMEPSPEVTSSPFPSPSAASAEESSSPMPSPYFAPLSPLQKPSVSPRRTSHPKPAKREPGLVATPSAPVIQEVSSSTESHVYRQTSTPATALPIPTVRSADASEVATVLDGSAEPLDPVERAVQIPWRGWHTMSPSGRSAADLCLKAVSLNSQDGTAGFHIDPCGVSKKIGTLRLVRDRVRVTPGQTVRFTFEARALPARTVVLLFGVPNPQHQSEELLAPDARSAPDNVLETPEGVAPRFKIEQQWTPFSVTWRVGEEGPHNLILGVNGPSGELLLRPVGVELR